MLSAGVLGAAVALVIGMVSSGAIFGESPDSLRWGGGLTLVLASCWLSVAVWGTQTRLRSWILTIGLAAFSLPGLMPVDLPTPARVGLAIWIAVICLVLVWGLRLLMTVRGVDLGLAFGTAVFFAMAIVPGTVEFIRSDFLPQTLIAIGSVSSGALVVLAGLDMKGWQEERGPTRNKPAALLIVGVLVLNGLVALLWRL
jgi:hypothetical protein